MANPNSFVGIDIQGITTLNERLKRLPKEAKDAGVESANEYIVNIMKVEPPKPTRPFVWSSDKQRRYVMAKIRSGEITPGTPNRTGNSTDSWQYVAVTDWNYTITNPEPGAYWTTDNYGQANQPAMVGWRKVTENIMDNLEGGIRSALSALSEWLKNG